VVIPETFKRVAETPPSVLNPVTTKVDAAALPNVDTPAFDSPVMLACPNVVMPVTLNLAKSMPSEALIPPVIVVTPVILMFVDVIEVKVEIPLKFAEEPVTDVRVEIPEALSPVVMPAMNKSLIVVSPNVLIPGAFRPVVIPARIRFLALTAPRVENPVTVKSVKVFGALTIAASIVAVVVASREAIF